MFLWDWITGILNYLGLYMKSGKLVLIGLDNAGKTTLLQVLRDDLMIQHKPTSQATCEELILNGIKLTAYDLGGHLQARRIWHDYYPAVDCIVYIIDAEDRTRFEESKTELKSLLSNEQIWNTPVLVLANKIDRPDAASEDEILKYFDLHRLVSGKSKRSRTRPGDGPRPLEVFMCSILNRQGYGDGIRWLSQYI